MSSGTSGLSLVGLAFIGMGGFLGTRFWRETKTKRAVNRASHITNKGDLTTKHGQYVVFEGKVKTDNPVQSIYILNKEGKNLMAAIYLMEDHKWLEVFEENSISVSNQFGRYFKRKQWVPKDQLIKKIELYRPFSVQSKKKGTVVPVKVKSKSADFPLLKVYDIYRPPQYISSEGLLLARVYETGFHSSEKFLEDGSKITVIGKLSNQGGVSHIGPADENCPYIVTYLPFSDVKKQLNSKGVLELMGSVVSVIVGIACIAAAAQQNRPRRE